MVLHIIGFLFIYGNFGSTPSLPKVAFTWSIGERSKLCISVEIGATSYACLSALSIIIGSQAW